MSAVLQQDEQLSSEPNGDERHEFLARLTAETKAAAELSDPTWVAFLQVLDQLAAAPGPSMTEELSNSRR